MNQAQQQAWKVRRYATYAALLFWAGLGAWIAGSMHSGWLMSRVFAEIGLFGTGDAGEPMALLHASNEINVWLYSFGVLAALVGYVFVFFAWRALKGSTLSAGAQRLVRISVLFAVVHIILGWVISAYGMVFSLRFTNNIFVSYAAGQFPHIALLFIATWAAWHCRKETGSPLFSAVAILDSDAGADDPAIRMKG